MQTPVINLNPAEICGLMVARAALGADEVIKMDRRNFTGAICGAALALASPCDADAQQPSKVWRIGEVAVGAPDRGGALAQEIEQGLADLGDVQGRNIVLTTQFVEPQVDKVQEGIISLLPQIDLLVTWSTIGG